MKNSIIKKINSAPKTPGLYIFYDRANPLYIGKANKLKDRLKNYIKTIDLKNQIIHQEATRLKLIKLSSPIEALIQETKLIKELKPRLNVYWSDDKNHFYVVITKENFPKIFITHQPQSSAMPSHNAIIGPFTDGRALRLVLKIIRRNFPYCTCRKSHFRQCLNLQIGFCPGYCCTRRSLGEGGLPQKYQKNIKTIKDLLSGKKKKLLQKITNPSDTWAMENIIEHSNFLRKPAGKSTLSPKPLGAGELGGLQGLAVAESSEGRRWSGRTGLRERVLFPAGFRIECYDISNFAGKEAVGAMTVLIKKNDYWESDKSQYRKFKIKYTYTRDDPRMMAEILKRRLNHPEWPYPNLIIVDGGITQYNAAKKVLGKTIKVISLAKPNKKIYGSTTLPKQIIERAINQTHRYVINYHRRLRDKVKV